jgi:drug/metabolite transporter (DMT)-like permease
MPHKSKALTLLFLLGFIWGTGYSIARFATTHGVPSLGYSFWQAIGPALLLCLITFQRKKNHIQISKTHFKYYSVAGLTGIVIPNTTMYFAAPRLPAGILAVIVNTVPILAYPMALIAGSESFNWVRLSGLFFAILGIMLIILPKSSLNLEGAMPWVLIVLITPFSFAFCSVYIARFKPTQSSSLSLSAGTLAAASLILIPLILWRGDFYALHLPLTPPDFVILLEIILSSMGYILFFQLIKIAGPVYYSLVDTIVSLTGLFWGSVLFHEKLNEWTIPAVLFIFLALILVTQQQKILYQSDLGLKNFRMD